MAVWTQPAQIEACYGSAGIIENRRVVGTHEADDHIDADTVKPE